MLKYLSKIHLFKNKLKKLYELVKNKLLIDLNKKKIMDLEE
jgi:hypothetical protein